MTPSCSVSPKKTFENFWVLEFRKPSYVCGYIWLKHVSLLRHYIRCLNDNWWYIRWCGIDQEQMKFTSHVLRMQESLFAWCLLVGGGETSFIWRESRDRARKREKPLVQSFRCGCCPACSVHQLSLFLLVRAAQHGHPLLEASSRFGVRIMGAGGAFWQAARVRGTVLDVRCSVEIDADAFMVLQCNDMQEALWLAHSRSQRRHFVYFD